MEGSATRVYSVQPASKLLEKDVKLQEMGIVPPLPGLDNFLKDVPLNQKTTPNKMPELSVKSPFILPSAGDEIIRIGLLLPLTGFNRELAIWSKGCGCGEGEQEGAMANINLPLQLLLPVFFTEMHIYFVEKFNIVHAPLVLTTILHVTNGEFFIPYLWPEK